MTSETQPVANPRHCTRQVTQRVELPDGTIRTITVTERRLKKQHDKQVANERRRHARRAADRRDSGPVPDSGPDTHPVSPSPADIEQLHAADTDY